MLNQGFRDERSFDNHKSRAGMPVNARRDGVNVTLTIVAHDEYQSMEVYDRIIQSLGKGSLNLNFQASNVPTNSR